MCVCACHSGWAVRRARRVWIRVAILLWEKKRHVIANSMALIKICYLCSGSRPSSEFHCPLQIVGTNHQGSRSARIGMSFEQLVSDLLESAWGQSELARRAGRMFAHARTNPQTAHLPG